MAKAQRKAGKRRDRHQAATKEQCEQACEEQTREYESQSQEAVVEFASRRRKNEENERRLQQVEEDYPRQIQQCEDEFTRHIMSLSETYRQNRAADQAEYHRQWEEFSAAWSQAMAQFKDAIGEMNAFCEAQFPAWNVGRGTAPSHSASQSGDIPALRLGRYAFDLARVEGGVPNDARLERAAGPFEIPAVLSYPDCPSLLLEAGGEGRDAATAVIQNVMLRLLTVVSAGQSAVHDHRSRRPGAELLGLHAPGRLRREAREQPHLDRVGPHQQRLADLTEHMENVIQKYLRNEFASIQEYNAQAGEVAEPFQILVVANFPANFSDEAARRLVSIAASGARCGVYTLISADTKLQAPAQFRPGRSRIAGGHAGVERRAETVCLEGRRRCGRCRWTSNCRQATSSSRPSSATWAAWPRMPRASKCRSPRSIPAADQWWTADSRTEIEVPLGRAGAKKLQYMRLGKGTCQHVLIAGKTGSGKSTLLNAMITNLAIHYSPSELQFYLIDFKKGVEFKAYAACRLPHARVIAIESEREFGMSVLERLDLELKRRGDLFRQHGVQDLKGYRNADPAAVMPRILLVIDEFQEFFTTDDKISHDSALLLDRLVRQGRAFGIHVLLGSQTLAGAYSLARSTLGQMAVRIALQCSESDAHLILSEDNTAARLLNRPGEAIYNDANGLFEGNHPFQVVWLSDHQRESYLRQLAARAAESNLALGAADDLRGERAGRSRRQRRCSAKCSPHTNPRRQQGTSPSRSGLARLGRGDQGSHACGAAPPGRLQPAGGRPTGRHGAGHPGQLPDRARRSVWGKLPACQWKWTGAAGRKPTPHFLRARWHAARIAGGGLLATHAGPGAARCGRRLAARRGSNGAQARGGSRTPAEPAAIKPASPCSWWSTISRGSAT